MRVFFFFFFLDPCALKIIVERYFWELKMLFGSCLCFSPLEKLFLKSWLDTSSIANYLSSFLSFFLSQSRQHLDTWWIDRDLFSLLLICPSTDPRQLHLLTTIMLDTCLAISQSIKILLHALFFTCFAYFFIIFMSIVSCFSFSCRSMVPYSFSFSFFALWQSCQKGGEIWELNVIPQGE